MLWLVQRILFGPLKEPRHDGPAVQDLNGIEIAALAPIAAACLWIGLYPNFFLSRMEPAVRQVAERLELPTSRTTMTGSIHLTPSPLGGEGWGERPSEEPVVD